MGGARPGGWLQHRKSARPEQSLQVVTLQNDHLSGAGLVVPGQAKSQGSEPQMLTGPPCFYRKAHFSAFKTKTSVVCLESENVSGGKITFTSAAKQLQNADSAKPGSGKIPLRNSMDPLFNEVSIQRTEFQPIWAPSESSGRERKPLFLETQVGVRVSRPMTRTPGMTLTPLKSAGQ